MTPFETDFRAYKCDGTMAWVEARSVPARLADDSMTWHGYFFDVTDRKQSESEIEKLAFYDPLTGLPNRRLLRDRLAQALTGSNRDHNHGALVFIDLDNFKNINDSAGHLTGDELLVQVGERLKKHGPGLGYRCPARWGRVCSHSEGVSRRAGRCCCQGRESLRENPRCPQRAL